MVSVDEYEYSAISNRVGKTFHYTDRVTNAILIRGARNEADRYDVIDCIMNAHAAWLDWQTTTQRKWQRETRNPNKARHHDSISIRESYVKVRT